MPREPGTYRHINDDENERKRKRLGRTHLVLRFIQGRRGATAAAMDSSEWLGVVGKLSMIISGGMELNLSLSIGSLFLNLTSPHLAVRQNGN